MLHYACQVVQPGLASCGAGWPWRPSPSGPPWYMALLMQ